MYVSFSYDFLPFFTSKVLKKNYSGRHCIVRKKNHRKIHYTIHAVYYIINLYSLISTLFVQYSRNITQYYDIIIIDVVIISLL